MNLPELTDRDVDRIVADMDGAGFAMVRGYLGADDVASARRFVEGALQRHGGEYFSLPGIELVRGSVLAELGESPQFRDLLGRICARVAPAASDERVYQVLRVLKGRTGLRESFRFHYDAYVVTALAPIAIPQAANEPRGDLVMYPRLRALRSSAWVNVVEKAFMQNPLAQRFMNTALARRRFKAMRLEMEPGNLYLFWGYRTLHGNEPCLPGSLRATALFHFGDPHRDSLLTRGVQRLRFWREARVRARTGDIA